MKHLLPILAFSTMLLACTSDQKLKVGSRNLSAWSEYSIFSETQFVDRIVRNDTSIAYTTYDAPTIKNNPQDFSIYVYPPSLKNCSASVTGILPPSQKTIEGIGDKTVTGKASTTELHWIYDIVPEDTACNRPTGTGGGYAFCSEKDGKTVLICVSQQTDNPQMVEEIFKTFRWTD